MAKGRDMLARALLLAALADSASMPDGIDTRPHGGGSKGPEDFEYDHHGGHFHQDHDYIRPPSFDCHKGSGDVWSERKRMYCCDFQNIGCQLAPTYNCASGLLSWKTGWSDTKKMWCCKHKGLGCLSSGDALPFDCDAGRENWRNGWSDGKKHWCCHHDHIGCDLMTPEPPKPFDCNAGLWNFREGWSHIKKDWCCTHANKGCEENPDVVILPSTDKPVAKCAGFDKELSACMQPPCLDSCEAVHCEFSDWSMWSNLGGCYGLCQRERRILQQNNECGRPCHGPKVVTKAGGAECLPEDRCRFQGNVDCVWDDWSQWSNTCYNVVMDQTHRWRRIAVEPAFNGRPCEGSFNETRACSHVNLKDCKFTLWSTWTECSASCQSGTQSRLRRVDTFAEHGGKTCDGMLREARVCNEELCPNTVSCEVGAWESWEGCTEAMFQRFRHRSLESVPEVAGGQELFCEYSLMETEGCAKAATEPHLCKFTSWTEWGSCSKECDGSQVRNRSILEYMKKTCHVSETTTLMEVQNCGSRSCHNRPCELSTWSEWSTCSHRCGPGETYRTREVVSSGNCETVLKEARDCMVAVCKPEDCAWGDWTFWSSCSKSCGGGVHRRHRIVATAPRHGGQPCEPLAGEEVGICNNETCSTCVDGQWGPWEGWGQCSGTCKPAFRVRHRDPVKFPNHCGTPALGLEDEYELCDNLQECDESQDCMLSSWSLWSDCSCECFGIKERNKRIVRNAKGSGKPCNETLKEVWPCNPGTGEHVPVKCLNELTEGDCKLSEWNDWTECSATCDGGDRERERSVVSPNKKGGTPCNDTLKEVEPCGTEQCQGVKKCQSCEWGAWSEWGLCSKCGGQRYRHRIIAKMPDFCGKLCDPGSAKEVSTCHSQCADEIFCLWSPWGDSSGCSSQCGHSVKMRQRHLTTTTQRPMWDEFFFQAKEGAACSGTQLKSELCDFVPCAGQAEESCEPVDCEFNTWSSWGEPSCTQLCERHRTIFQINSCGGNPCEGATVETKHCVKADCQEVKDCEFSDWHSWQGMCVNDQKVRWRVVQQPATNGGASCCGPIKETRPCSAMEGPDIYLQDGDASPWSSWSSCTRRCGGGLRTRKRRVEVEAKNGGYPFCGPLEVMEPCNQDPCAEGDGVEGDNCELTNWDNWSPCTESNIQYRNRQIAKDAKLGGVPCEDGLRMVRECTSAVDCVVSPWTPWDRCTRTCGGGQTFRHRQVTRNPRFGGKPCLEQLIQTTGCNDDACNLEDAQVSAWSSWGACDTDCGSGQRSRTRVVTRSVKEGGIGFYGPLKEIDSCVRQECGEGPQDCIWGEWTDWTGCNRGCGGGQKTRTRRIARVPRNGGRLCVALVKEEIHECNTAQCADSSCVDGLWGQWSMWEACSSTCHGGVTWRTRSVAMEANECGAPPLGFSMEHRGCNWEVTCNPNQDCRFGDWYEWGKCTAACYGVRERSRKIAQHGRGQGQYCQGPLRETRPCAEEQGCPHAGENHADKDCKLTTWSSWGDCDRPCGTGQMVRTRSVDQPGQAGGRPCDSDLAQVAPCTAAPCDNACEPQDCQWSEWSDWGACDQCDGQMRRFRRVHQPGKCGGHVCLPGASEQTEKCPRFCHAQTYCGWSDWESWGDCSVTCGIGTKGRVRHLSPLAQPPQALHYVKALFQCGGEPRGWVDDELRWCCKNMPREGCEHEVRLRFQEEVEQNEVKARLDSLLSRTKSLESHRIFQMISAWGAGSFTVLALTRLLRRRDDTPSSRGFHQLGNEGE